MVPGQLNATQRGVLQLLLASSLSLLVVGIFSPLLKITQLWFFSSESSLVSAVHTLFTHQEWALAGVITLFAITVPIVKSLATFWFISRPINQTSRKRLDQLNLLGKWSMLDVFIVAFMVVATKLASLAQAEVQYGLYLLLVAALSNIFISIVIDRQLKL